MSAATKSRPDALQGVTHITADPYAAIKLIVDECGSLDCQFSRVRECTDAWECPYCNTFVVEMEPLKR